MRRTFAAIVVLLAGVLVAWLAGCATPGGGAIEEADGTRRIPRTGAEDGGTDLVVRPDDRSSADLSGFREGSPVRLSIEQAILIAIDRNADLSIEELTPEIVGAFEGIERGRYDPELFATGTVAREKVVEVSRSTEASFRVEGDEFQAEAGVRQSLPTGTEVEIAVGHELATSSRTPDQHEARAALTLTQSLLRGLGPAVNLAAVRQAELATLASLYELRGFTEALVADVERAYWRYVLAGQEIAIFEESLAIARKERDEIEQRIAVGLLAETESAAARTEVAIREQALIDARSNLETRRLRLLRLLNPLPENVFAWDLAATTDPGIDPQPIDDPAERVRLAGQLRADVNEARLRLEENRLETVLTRNGLLPRLDLFIALGKSGFADNYSDAAGNLDGDTYDVTAGIGLVQALGDRAAKSRHHAAGTALRQATLAVSNLVLRADLDVRLAITEAERARQQIAATAATRAAQEDTVEAERERFAVGSSTALLVAQAQRDLLGARIAEVGSIVQHRIALVDLYLAEGSLLERRGIRMDATERGGAAE